MYPTPDGSNLYSEGLTYSSYGPPRYTDNRLSTSQIDNSEVVSGLPPGLVYVTDEAQKYIYSETGWVVPSYDIPLQISLDVFVESTYTGTLGDLTQEIREALVEEFTDRFGINVNIYRSEIIDVVQEVEGVDHCRLIDPVSSIFFNFDIDDFTQQQLLEYAPEYVYFTEDDISMRVF